MKKTIVLTRPIAQSQTLATKLRAKNMTVVFFPTFSIQPLAGNTPLAQPDLLIFTSANAVLHGKQAINKTTKTIAIGPATARALQQHGVQNSIIPTEHNSEGVLALASLQHIKGKNIALITGKNTRPLLPTTLSARGANVEICCVYQRDCPTEHSDAMLNSQPDIIVCTSGTSVKNLYHMTQPAQRKTLLDQQLLVISPRIAARSKALGFTKPALISDGGSDQAIIACLV